MTVEQPAGQHDFKLQKLAIRGFRSFGTEVATFSTLGALTVIHARNSQGKSSLAEAIEFLFTGQSCRRDLLGGAKSEYDSSLTNAHLPNGDRSVYVEATVLDPSGARRSVRRELVSDYQAGSDCVSVLTVDGEVVESLREIGAVLADAPLAAPVLLQHTLRYVLSTEPKQRVAYFKALLSLTDLDDFLSALVDERKRLEALAVPEVLRSVAALRGTEFESFATAVERLTETVSVEVDDDSLLRSAVLTSMRNTHVGSEVDGFQDVAPALGAHIGSLRRAAFPLDSFGRPGSLRSAPLSDVPGIGEYIESLAEAEGDAARLVPLFEIALGLPEVSDVETSADCVLCGAADTVTVDRVTFLRAVISNHEMLTGVSTSLLNSIARYRNGVNALGTELRNAAPEALEWDVERQGEVTQLAAAVDVSQDMLEALYTRMKVFDLRRREALDAMSTALTGLAQVQTDVEKRGNVPAESLEECTALARQVANLKEAANDLSTAQAEVASLVESRIEAAADTHGYVQMQDLIPRLPEVATAVKLERARRRKIGRAKAAEGKIKAGIASVLDARFASMSSAIVRWWSAIRPDELVTFDGVRRVATGSRFVNLVGSLRASGSASPIERDALGVFSDSQLNALGLSTFLARNELLGGRIVVLDDPIPGSDIDHRMTFIENTLGGLLDQGTQTIVLTHDPALAKLAASNHAHRDVVIYEMTLHDGKLGTTCAATSDVFRQFIAEADNTLASQSESGRRTTAVNLRSAAERLAKQIIATGRTAEGAPCSVAEVDAEASLLSQLVSLVSPYAVDAAERGKWRTVGTVLNPGGHDDDAPSQPDLKHIRGNLIKIWKDHSEHWDGGLLM